MTARRLQAAAAALLVPLVAGAAHAGGLSLPTRGVRPTARGGAFCAGADDLGALWFNPAGLAALAGGPTTDVMLDVGWVKQSVEYRRIDSGMNQDDTVSNQAPGAPVPTLGAGFDAGHGAVVAAGLYAPYAGLSRFDSDGPQRYSLVDNADTIILIGELAAGWQATPALRVGAGFQNAFVSLASSMVFSGCPGETVCAPEDPEFDSLAQMRLRDMFNPSGVLGAQLRLGARARAGVAFQLPIHVSGDGKMSVRLPESGFFAGAQVVGDTAAVSLTLPAMVRAGIEVSPAARWRAELGFDYEMWSEHDRYKIEPRDVRIENTPGAGTYELGDVSIERGFGDTVSVKLGVEGQPAASTPLVVRAGYAYETAAAPDALLSVLTVDGARQLFAGGLAYSFGRTTVEATFAHVSVASRSVDPSVGVAPQLTPIRSGDAATPVYVNWGDYQSSWLVIGAGVHTAF